MDRAFITGVSGQDGSYLADFLLAAGLEVYGLVRRRADATNWRILHLLENSSFHLVPGDIGDLSTLTRILADVRPRYVFNLAAQSFVQYSWHAPIATAEATGLGVLNMLEAVRAVDPAIRFYQASSSEMFGNAPHAPQHEDTLMRPRSPYGVAKLFGHHITVNYRESYGLFACSGILFNHESQRRGLEFVTRKVTWAVVRIKAGLQDTLALGNLDAARDWGYAPDYVRAMWLMLRADEANDYVVATGVTRSIRQLCETAFGVAGLEWDKYVVTDERFLRPAELHELRGDASRIGIGLGWQPEVNFEQMIERMVAADMMRVEGGVNWES
ncbi:MAG: GDP-mannose 4,6-dehydratase [bacterium]|nr:GDP-mannose 4,6-dehydratase [bacterium]